jgi:lipid-A-disaccharide synthase
LGLAANDAVVALLPGSRSSEIRHLSARFFQAAKRIKQARPEVKFVLPAVPGLLADIQAIAAAQGVQDWVQIVSGQSHTVLAACDVTLIASGTATLEAALFKRPMVIAYHMAWLSWQIMRRKKLQPWVGLPNILCQEFVVPELLQDAATPEALAAAVLDWLSATRTNPTRIALLEQRFADLHVTLQRDTSTLARHAIEQVLQS